MRFIALFLAASAATTPLAAQKLIRIPTRFAADRYFATPVTTKGDTVVLFIDSGGGGVWVIKPALEKLAGRAAKFEGVEDGDSIFSAGKFFPTFRPDASIPAPIGQPDGLFAFGTKAMSEFEGAVGMLGHTWYAGRVWVTDYAAQTLSVYDTPPAPKPFGPHTIPMTLKRPPLRNHPRIRVLVDGDTIDMLLDTGATSMLTPEAVKALGGGPATRASSFVAKRLTDRWRTKHPEWRILPKAEMRTGADLIEVPKLTVGGFEVGPVWFAMRSNAPYDNMMAALMDKPILASLGGNAFHGLRLTMDYPNQRVTFERP